MYATAPGDLAGVRGTVVALATGAGLDNDRTARLIVAVNEIVTNAITHGVPPATVTISTTGTTVLVAVHDRGSGFSVEPVPGPPGKHDVHGRGLWLATNLCDRVDVRTDPAGTTVTLAVGL